MPFGVLSLTLKIIGGIGASLRVTFAISVPLRLFYPATGGSKEWQHVNEDEINFPVKSTILFPMSHLVPDCPKSYTLF